MPYRSMTIKELADMLGTDSRRLERMARRGELPCQKVAGQFRFNRAEITAWLQQNMAAMNGDHLAQVDAGITAHRQARQDEAIVTGLLCPQAVACELGARTKSSALRKLVALAEQTGRVYDRQALLDAVRAREALCSTALPAGIAIPHPRRPLPYALAEPVLAVARARQGIVFGAPDRRRTHLFFLTASQDDRHHLHVLARLCRILRDDDVVQQLLHADTVEEMMGLLEQRERIVISQSG